MHSYAVSTTFLGGYSPLSTAPTRPILYCRLSGGTSRGYRELWLRDREVSSSPPVPMNTSLHACAATFDNLECCHLSLTSSVTLLLPTVYLYLVDSILRRPQRKVYIKRSPFRCQPFPVARSELPICFPLLSPFSSSCFLWPHACQGFARAFPTAAQV